MKNISILLFLLILTSACHTVKTGDEQDVAIESARSVLQRLLGSRANEIKFSSIPKINDCDIFQYESKDGELTLQGSSGIAICRGFYDYLKSNKLGIVSWSGTRLDIPATWPTSKCKRVVSPYKFHYYLNVVTYGYTTPHWDWQRWQQEIDWMALHGMDMPLALVANEAIASRVWKKLGLTQSEIDQFYTAPAFLPWQRMGNLTKLHGGLSSAWHQDQIVLQHQLLKRMRALGMQPIVPAFAGFVPKGLKRLYPEINLFHPQWAGFSADMRTSLLLPDTPLFVKIGKLYIEEWEREFGKCDYYLADSFNEMDIPAPKDDKQRRYKILSNYGEQVYRSIKAGNPDAVWVMQGWMFGYQRYIWDRESLAALVSKVPNEKMLLLDLAADYNARFWHNGMNWDFYAGFFGKPWICSVIPNMGGKTAYTGDLSYYAKAYVEALNSPNKGELVGVGFAPEGIENNEVIYELLADMGWQSTAMNLDLWLKNYCQNRYGAYPESMQKAWSNLRKSCFGTFTDHPRFNWQFHPSSRRGTVNSAPEFIQAVAEFASANELTENPNYQADLIEVTAIYLGIKIEQLLQHAMEAEAAGMVEVRKRSAAKALELMAEIDRLLESHPLHRLSRWIEFARKSGATEAEKDRYEVAAKDLVTTWGGCIDDYSARIWSGLIRDYYIPRWQLYLANIDADKAVDIKAWERSWTKISGVSQIEPFANPVKAARRLIKAATAIKLPNLQQKGDVIGRWSPNTISTSWQRLEWDLPAESLTKIKGVRFVYTRGGQRLDIRNVVVIADGRKVAEDNHFGYAGTPSKSNFYRLKIATEATGNNRCLIRAEVRGNGGSNSFGQLELIKSNSRK